MFRFKPTRFAGIALAALAFAACDDETITPDQPVTIAATAAATADLSTLVTALQSANLVSALEGDGPFTVFAPLNSAFSALDPAVLQGLLADGNMDVLSRVLTFHVIPGTAALSTDLTDGQTLTTLEGGTLTVGVSGSGVTVNGANVITANVEATNGVVHIIDGVLLPAMTDVYETAVLTGGTTTLATAVLAAGLDATLTGTGPFTVFAPINSAFEALETYTLEALLDPANADILTKTLTFHVIADDVRAAALTDGGMAPTVEGGMLTFDLSDPLDPKVNGASIIDTDIVVDNGVIHLVDEVLLPPFDIVERARITEETQTLAAAVTAADLVSTLEGAGPFTVFAPINDAFDALGAGTLAALLDPANQAILQDVLTYHVIADDIFEADLTDGAMVPTAEGGMLMIDLSDPMDPKVNGASIIATDIVTENGVIHLIDGVLTESVNIVERATVTDGTGTLASAVVAASANSSTDVAAVLSGAGPYTVFAPIDAAFAALGTDRLNVLLDPANGDLLAKVLTYHAIPGTVRAADLTDGAMVTTLGGADLMIDLSDPMMPKVNGANIITTDIETENGVIHLIDGVLTENLDLVDVATVEGFPTLVQLVAQQSLEATLRSDNGGAGWTVFAPTEAAFAALSSVPMGQALTDILTYHVLDSEVASTALSDGLVVTSTVNGASFTVNINGSAVTITDQAGSVVNVVLTDVQAENGIIHVIDAVLNPTP